MNSPTNNPVRPANWLLAKLRNWHTWTGLAAALFLLVISLTGIVLNYKKPIFQALGLEARPPEPKATPNEKAGHVAAPALPAGKLGGLPITFDQALALARAEFGEAVVERVELKREPDDWLYKIKRQGGAELWISASSGAHFIKGDYEKVKRAAAAAPVKSFDWGKLMLDLHTGKIGGPVGVAVMTGVAGLLFFFDAFRSLHVAQALADPAAHHDRAGGGDLRPDCANPRNCRDRPRRPGRARGAKRAAATG